MAPDRAALAPPAGGMLLSAVLARRLAATTGDTLTVEVLEGRRQVLRLPVAGVVEELLGLLGLHALRRRAPAAARSADRHRRATGWWIRCGPEPAQRAGSSRCRPSAARPGSTPCWTASSGPSPRASGSRSRVMLVFAVVIAGGVVYNAARVALAERGRELASLRVLGFTRGEVSAMLLGEQARADAGRPSARAGRWAGCSAGWSPYASRLRPVPHPARHQRLQPGLRRGRGAGRGARLGAGRSGDGSGGSIWSPCSRPGSNPP